LSLTTTSIGRVAAMTNAVAPAAKRRWFETQWDALRLQLPPAPAHVIELGCGPYGGFVPALRQAGFDALGVDPEAPAAPGYHRREFEQFQPPWPADAVIACTSLHHTADLPQALEHIAQVLRPGGVLAVIEWDWQRFDERAARWCFDRLPPTDEPGWLHNGRDHWQASGQSWSDFITAWATEERLHTGDSLVAALTERFQTRVLDWGPYFFADLEMTPAMERAAIDAGELQATGIYYVATKP
jgi:SAM-dependent methyltransferase